MVMTEGATQAAAGSGAGIAVLRAPEELDLATADGVAARGCAIAGHAGLLLLDLTGLSFCDARGLSAFVRIANQADRAGCRLALIAPQPPVAKVLRICRLDQRLPVFATTGHALAGLTAVPRTGVTPVISSPRSQTCATAGAISDADFQRGKEKISSQAT
jgi:anti-sigma B factor antagonist